MTRIFSLSAAAVMAALSFVPPAQADALDSAARVDMAGKLPMLSQRVPSAMCNLAAGVQTDVASNQMRAAAAEFDRIAAALVYGDRELGITTRETDADVLADIAELQDAWGPIRSQVYSLLTRAPSTEDIDAVAPASEDLLSAAKALVVSVRSDGDNANPLPQALALTIDIASRQQMLAQRMSKNACLILEGSLATSPGAELAGVMEAYGSSLWALRFGLKDAGIIAPPTPEIAALLEDIAVDWATLAPILASIRGGGQPDQALRGQVFLGLNSLTRKMNTAVGLYVGAASASS